MDLTTRYLLAHALVGALIVAALLYFYGGVRDYQFVGAFTLIYLVGMIVVDKIGILEKLKEYIK